LPPERDVLVLPEIQAVRTVDGAELA